MLLISWDIFLVLCIKPKSWRKASVPRLPFSSSPGSLCLHDDAGLPSEEEEKSNLPECSGIFFSHLKVNFKFSWLFPSHTENLQGLTLPHCITLLVIGLPQQLVTKQFCSVGESSFWLRQLLTDLCSNSDISLSQRDQQSKETEINGKTWSLKLLGRLERVSFRGLFHFASLLPLPEITPCFFSAFTLRHSPEKPIWGTTGQQYWHTASHSTSLIQKIHLWAGARTLVMGPGGSDGVCLHLGHMLQNEVLLNVLENQDRPRGRSELTHSLTLFHTLHTACVRTAPLTHCSSSV